VAQGKKHRMAGIITIAPGHDASYPWRQDRHLDRSPEPGRAGTSYITWPRPTKGRGRQAVQVAGSPTWGFREGQVIEREVFERCTGTSSIPVTRPARRGWDGRRSGSVAAKKSSRRCSRWEPEATAERRAQLMNRAKSQVRRRCSISTRRSACRVDHVIARLRDGHAARAAAAGDLERCVLGAGRHGRVGVRAGRNRAGWSTCSERRDTRGRGITAGRPGRCGPSGGRRARVRRRSFAQHTSGTGTRSCTSQPDPERVRRESDGAYGRWIPGAARAPRRRRRDRDGGDGVRVIAGVRDRLGGACGRARREVRG